MLPMGAEVSCHVQLPSKDNRACIPYELDDQPKFKIHCYAASPHRF